MNQTILLIEDDLELAEHIFQILTLAEYQVIHVSNGVEGVKKAISHPPDLILSGILTPELDAYGVIQILSHNEKTKWIPFIFLFNNFCVENVRTAMNYGADDFLPMPFEAGELLKTVEVRLNKKCPLKTRQESGKKSQSSLELDYTGNGIQAFLKTKGTRTLKKKDIIFLEGQIPGNLYWIKSGKVKNFKTNSYGKELITSIQGEGEFLGYLPLFKNSPYEESAEALEEVELQLVSKEEFLSILQSDHEFSLKFIQLISKELIDLEDRLIDLAYQPVRQRVARVLLSLENQFSRWGNSSRITVSRKDISNIIGTAPETLNRMLAEFKEEGLIESDDSGLKIKDNKRLKKVAKS